jgi:membrane peptidoglycan carboxypeptidase
MTGATTDPNALRAVAPAMSFIEHLAEKRIAEAMARGDFDDLPGAGKPLTLEDDGMVPEDLRAAYRMLRNAGYLPPELQLLNEIRNAEDLLRAMDESPERQRITQRLAVLRARLGERRSRALEAVAYRDRLRHTLDR